MSVFYSYFTDKLCFYQLTHHLTHTTLALDSESELVVQEALDQLLAREKRTTVIIAHRLTTIRNADVIVVIAGGQVVEMGTHDSLMESPDGHYRALVQKQEHSLKGGEVAQRTDSEKNLASLNSGVGSSGDLMALTKSLGDATQLKFTDVTFAYPTRPNKPILDRFKLSVRRGETLALVGPSGALLQHPQSCPCHLFTCASSIYTQLTSSFALDSSLSWAIQGGGKSTTIGLLERFYDPDQGSIEFEGVDLKELNIQWYRDQVGIVSQEVCSFFAMEGRERHSWCYDVSSDIHMLCVTAITFHGDNREKYCLWSAESN